MLVAKPLMVYLVYYENTVMTLKVSNDLHYALDPHLA